MPLRPGHSSAGSVPGLPTAVVSVARLLPKATSPAKPAIKSAARAKAETKKRPPRAILDYDEHLKTIAEQMKAA